jgi:hypothetical protein
MRNPRAFPLGDDVGDVQQFDLNNPARDDGPPAMPEQEYSDAALAEYRTVLDAATHEKDMQTFFEEHPPLLPFAFPEYTGHGPHLGALISQPELTGLGSRQPDFLWLTRDSAEIRPVLIEIETPTKKWTTTGKNPQPTAHLTQALNQLRQWREWMNRLENVLIFRERFGVPQNWRQRRFRPMYVLIYGRKDENPDEIGRLRAEHQSAEQQLITYDHIRPESRQTGYISVKNNGVGTFRALHMPATASLSPGDPDEWLKITERAPMVERNNWISDERKRYLVDERLPSWTDWARNYHAREAELREARRAARNP